MTVSAPRPQAIRDRDRMGTALLVVLLLSIFTWLPFATWHSSPSVDGRTHIEMIRGIADHGLPYSLNGPTARFHELQARWNVLDRDGVRLWGVYPPLFDYLAAPFFAWGGLAAVSRFNVVVLALYAVFVFLLGDAVLEDRLFAAVAAWVATVGSPIASTGIDISPYVLSEALSALSLYLIVRAGKRGWSKATAVGAGAAGGLAATAHLLAISMVVATVAVVTISHYEDDPTAKSQSSDDWRVWLPTLPKIQRASWVLLGLALSLLPLALLNHVRFGSYNPVSYGPCVWESCADTGLDKQHLSAMISRALPPFLFCATTTYGLLRFRKNLLACAALTAVAGLVAFAWQGMVTNGLMLGKVIFALVVDATPLTLDPWTRAADGIGYVVSGWALRSTLQCSPVLALALLYPRVTRKDRRSLLYLAVPTIALLCGAALRATPPMLYAIGFPFIYERYATLAIAPASVLAAGAMRSLPWTKLHLAVVIAASTAVTLALLSRNDVEAPRRLFILYGPLLVALAAMFFLRRAQQGDTNSAPRAAWAAAAAVTMGIGTCSGVTLPAVLRMRLDNDSRVDAVAKLTPQRFALAGFSPEIDTPLALRATRDIEYIDLFESNPKKGWTNFRRLIDVWSGEGRPIYTLFPVGANISSPWPDIVFEPVLADLGLFRVRKI